VFRLIDWCLTTTLAVFQLYRHQEKNFSCERYSLWFIYIFVSIPTKQLFKYNDTVIVATILKELKFVGPKFRGYAHKDIFTGS
jgi:hypothetical protein